MKKSVFTAIANYVATHDVPELASVRDEILAEFEKNEAKAQVNRDLYAEAHDVVMKVMDSTPRTITEIYELCAPDLPDGFSKSKIQYAMREYWAGEVVKVENPKGANEYRIK